jgi:hypothetical protein
MPEVSLSCDQVLPAIDRDNRTGDVARAIADQERSQSAEVVDVHQLVVRRSGGLSGQQFVEAGDPAGGSGADSPRRDRVRTDTFWS